MRLPGRVGGARRGVLARAAEAAGLGRVRLVDEPSAAATVFATDDRLPAGACLVVYGSPDGAGRHPAAVRTTGGPADASGPAPGSGSAPGSPPASSSSPARTASPRSAAGPGGASNPAKPGNPVNATSNTPSGEPCVSSGVAYTDPNVPTAVCLRMNATLTVYKLASGVSNAGSRSSTLTCTVLSADGTLVCRAIGAGALRLEADNWYTDVTIKAN